MDEEIYTDLTGTYCCPICRHESELQYVNVPPHTRNYTDDGGAQHVWHMAAARDYTCKDCGFEWSVDAEQE